jgi:hypothetical protein
MTENRDSHTPPPRPERTRDGAADAASPQKRGAGEKPRDKPVEEEADKDIRSDKNRPKNA